MKRLRVLDLGSSTPLRSQACYHGIAEAMQPDDDAVLILTSPNTPYLSVGLHQDITQEIDLGYCRQAGLAIIRRHTGGGTVLLDENQLFFHFIIPYGRGPQSPRELYPLFIEPIVRCYQALGINARWVAPNDIQVDGRKIGGTGAARINQASILVGSILFSFDHALMARCVLAPSEDYRQWFTRALATHMTTLDQQLVQRPTHLDIMNRLLPELQHCLGLSTCFDTPGRHELASIADWEHQLLDPDWLHQTGRKAVTHGVKIAWGVYLTETKTAGIRVLMLQNKGCIAELLLEQVGKNYTDLARALHLTPLQYGPLHAAIQTHLGGADDTEAQALSQAIMTGYHQE